ncbi:MAG: MotA/TolQ/ExbB proton channel family protein [Motiliproteus sp.]|nr:MotA/TolQ/ExbB proton channel family protein [Motiliproteus sp.]MCW9054293.1 MotA/TolQ/ExbB proton channel family protein [Motiliproteus sp.]
MLDQLSLLLSSHSQQLSGFLNQGGLVLWLIVLLSTLVWLLSLERYHFFFFRLQQENRYCLNQIKHSEVSVSRKLELQYHKQALFDAYQIKIQRYLIVIHALTNCLPLLGLLGTVSGMIITFEVLAEFGNSNSRALSSGISQALITTMAGLLTALPGLYFSSNLENKARNALTQMQSKLALTEVSR